MSEREERQAEVQRQVRVGVLRLLKPEYREPGGKPDADSSKGER
jgi:hypothetical protein